MFAEFEAEIDSKKGRERERERTSIVVVGVNKGEEEWQAGALLPILEVTRGKRKERRRRKLLATLLHSHYQLRAF